MNRSTSEIRQVIKRLIVERLHIEGLDLEGLEDDAPLGEEVGLDSVDALELAVALEQEFAIKIVDSGIDKNTFSSVAALAEVVKRRVDEQVPS